MLIKLKGCRSQILEDFVYNFVSFFFSIRGNFFLFACSKLTTEILEKGTNYVKRYQ